MRLIRLLAVSLVLPTLLTATAGRADEPPERLLSASTQLYLRWDGAEAHQAAFAKTAVGQMLQGDTGRFLTVVREHLREHLGPQLTAERLLPDLPAAKQAQFRRDLSQAQELLDTLGHRGFVLGAEVTGITEPKARVTLVLPGAGTRPAPFLAALRVLAAMSGEELKETRAGRRVIHRLTWAPVSLAGWTDGSDAALAAVLGPGDAADVPDRSLVGQALWQRVRDGRDFETGIRGFLDLAALVRLGRGLGDDTEKFLDDLGLGGVEDLVFHAGSDGSARRGRWELRAPPPRRGLVRLITDGRPFRTGDLPPLPPDVTIFSASSFDWAAGHDVLLQSVDALRRLTGDEELGQLKRSVQQAEDRLGVSIRNDLLQSLGGPTVLARAPSEGPFGLGQTVFVRVRDARRLQTALDKLLKVAQLPGSSVSVKPRAYRQATLYEVHLPGAGAPYLPTWTIYRDWLVLALYPQPVQGFVRRADGDLDAWRPGPVLRERWQRLPRPCVGVTVADPRPALRFLLSLAPTLAAAWNETQPNARFDVGGLPNAQEATRHLFPNLSVTTDDGTTVRWESWSSLWLPVY